NGANGGYTSATHTSCGGRNGRLMRMTLCDDIAHEPSLLLKVHPVAKEDISHPLVVMLPNHLDDLRVLVQREARVASMRVPSFPLNRRILARGPGEDALGTVDAEPDLHEVVAGPLQNGLEVSRVYRELGDELPTQTTAQPDAIV